MPSPALRSLRALWEETFRRGLISPRGVPPVLLARDVESGPARSLDLLAHSGLRLRSLLGDACSTRARAVLGAHLASLLERPPGLDEAALVDENVDLVLRYLVR